MRFIDWFSGIGGFRLGLERAGGFHCVAHSEIDDYCNRVYARHWPGTPNLGDIRRLAYLVRYNRQHGIRFDPRTALPVADLWVGGFPCPPFSAAGKRLGGADPRNIWPLWMRLIGAFRPRYVLAENVPGLLPRYYGHIVRGLAGAGYRVEWAVISAADLGAPHLRKRVWIWATHTDSGGVGQLLRGLEEHAGVEGTPWDQSHRLGARDGGTGRRFPTPDAHCWKAGPRVSKGRTTGEALSNTSVMYPTRS